MKVERIKFQIKDKNKIVNWVECIKVSNKLRQALIIEKSCERLWQSWAHENLNESEIADFNKRKKIYI